MSADYFTRVQLTLGLWNWRSANELLVATAALKIAVGAVPRSGLRRRIRAELMFDAGSHIGRPMGGVRHSVGGRVGRPVRGDVHVGVARDWLPILHLRRHCRRCEQRGDTGN